MSVLIQVQNISKQYGPTEIFDDANVNIVEGQKIGVIGRNGAGKSTFCRMIIGEEEPELPGEPELEDVAASKTSNE